MINPFFQTKIQMNNNVDKELIEGTYSLLSFMGFIILDAGAIISVFTDYFLQSTIISIPLLK